MKTRDLQTFVKAIELGSVSKAAKDLFITQSAASQRLKNLEERIGEDLLDRSQSTLQPTQPGTLVLSYAKRILALENEMLDQLNPQQSKDHLALCCTPTFGNVYLPPIIAEMTRVFGQQVEFDFVFEQPQKALDGLNQGLFDVAIIEHLKPLDKRSHHFECLTPDQLIFVASKHYPIESGVLSLEQVLAKRVYTRKPGCSSRALLEQNLAERQRSLQDFESLVVSDDLRLTIAQIKAAQGIALVSKALVHNELKNDELVGFSVDGFSHVRRRSMLVQHSRLHQPLMQAFIHQVHQAFEPH
ncbi:LysR family transcriptional regulator [Paraferrimonas sedimenticola]|uniref:LysR family transcriptional regulator n=1 Tax=Paraferrimonas sedimenticola TaxID=375674 RepID=A0AA37RW95_9GAMM|nr:LysR family transcriptional regulator [Paraferrimonas sedimenticola]GLP96454.1 LysR family transcriptional regulator [Paraferrimonas sedimenticola]